MCLRRDEDAKEIKISKHLTKKNDIKKVQPGRERITIFKLHACDFLFVEYLSFSKHKDLLPKGSPLYHSIRIMKMLEKKIVIIHWKISPIGGNSFLI